MYQPVDEERLTKIEGFCYTNQSGDVEHVKLNVDTVTITTDEDPDDYKDYVYIYYSDIPNLIKALQAAYDHKQKDISK